MSDQFTKDQALVYLGEVFSFKTDFQEIIDSKPQRLIKAGEVGKVKSVDIWDGSIKIALDVYGDYFSVDKQTFETHCVILRPEIIAHHTQQIIN